MLSLEELYRSCLHNVPVVIASKLCPAQKRAIYDLPLELRGGGRSTRRQGSSFVHMRRVGFTLIEILVVIVVIAILASLLHRTSSRMSAPQGSDHEITDRELVPHSTPIARQRQVSTDRDRPRSAQHKAHRRIGLELARPIPQKSCPARPLAPPIHV